MPEIEHKPSLTYTQDREILVSSPDFFKKLEEASKADGLLLICSDGALGGRSSVTSALLRKVHHTPAFYLAKGLKGLAQLPKEEQQKVAELIAQFKVVVLHPSESEIELFKPEEIECTNNLIRELKKSDVVLLDQTSESNQSFLNLSKVLELYKQQISL